MVGASSRLSVCFTLLTVTLFLSWSSSALAVSVLRRYHGVQPEAYHSYGASTFTCLDGSRTLPATAINDGYCHCRDGSDEPGTSACASTNTMRETMFFCRNEGFFGSFIRSSFVNDGVCDCCDGSDEFDVKNVGIDAAVPTQSTKCENTCAAKAEAYRTEAEAKLAISRRGLDRRAALQQEGTRKFQEMQQRRSELESRVAEIESQLNGAREDLRTFQDVASASDENGTSAKGEEGEETETKASEESTEQSQQQQEQQADEEQKQAEETQQQNNNSVLVQWLRNQVGRLAAVKDHLIHNWESYQSEREHGLDYLKKRIAQLEAELEPLRSQLSEVEAQLHAIDYGHGHEWLPLYKKTLTFSTHEYNYEVTLFDRVEQKDRSNGRLISTLGRFEKSQWIPAAGKMPFANGDRCWQGPARSIELRLECGAEPEVLKVEEPSRCEYVATVKMPTACNP